MGDDDRLDIGQYKDYGPPYLSGANVFGQGVWYRWYTFALVYITIVSWLAKPPHCPHSQSQKTVKPPSTW